MQEGESCTGLGRKVLNFEDFLDGLDLSSLDWVESTLLLNLDRGLFSPEGDDDLRGLFLVDNRINSSDDGLDPDEFILFFWREFMMVAHKPVS